MANDTHIPHGLRIAISFLRIAVGVGLFYLGWTVLFDSTLAAELRNRSFPGLYTWLLSLASPFAGIPSPAFAWIFLIVGILITIGLFTRLASIVAVVLVVANLLPAISFSAFNAAQIVNDEVVLLFCLLVIILGRGGQYLGLDAFVHVSRKKKE